MGAPECFVDVFPIKDGDIPIKHGDFPIKHGDFPIKDGDVIPASYVFFYQRVEFRDSKSLHLFFAGDIRGSSLITENCG